MTHLYETAFILRPDLEEEAREGLLGWKESKALSPITRVRL